MELNKDAYVVEFSAGEASRNLTITSCVPLYNYLGLYTFANTNFDLSIFWRLCDKLSPIWDWILSNYLSLMKLLCIEKITLIYKTFLSFSKVKICFPNGMILIFEGIVLKHENIDCLDPLKQFWKLLRLSLLASLYHEFWVFSYTDASNQNRRLLRKPYWNRGTLSQDYIQLVIEFRD